MEIQTKGILCHHSNEKPQKWHFSAKKTQMDTDVLWRTADFPGTSTVRLNLSRHCFHAESTSIPIQQLESWVFQEDKVTFALEFLG